VDVLPSIRSRHPALLPLLLVTTWAAIVVWTAWAADDAFITLRTVDNALAGYGLRFNIDERVQAYTHPLWLFATLAVTALAGSAYHAVTWLSIACSVATVGLVVWRVAPTPFGAVLAVTLLVASRAFVDYSTSGLENPLTHLLLVLFVLVWWNLAPAPRKTFWLSLVVAAVMLNRLDAGILLLPALMHAAWQRPARPHVVAAAAGFVPLLAWEAFSVAYYGVPFPNTAYAKLGTGVSQIALIGQALHYFANSLWTDLPTLATVAVTLGLVARRDRRSDWPLVLGPVLYLLYILRIGGDFMAGRFFAAPFLLSVLVICHGTVPAGRIGRAALVVGLLAVRVVLLVVHFEISMPHGITDQRKLYSEGTRLVTQSAYPLAGRPEAVRGAAWRDGRRHVVEWGMIGMTGYFAGPDVHMVDPFALADPLLSRRPADPNSRIGHFERRVPDGYVRSIRTRENHLESRALVPLYDDIRLVTRGPVWTWERWRAIVRLNLRS
jgi:arabinofuranosyltransferase